MHCVIGVKDRDVLIVYVQNKGIKVIDF